MHPAAKRAFIAEMVEGNRRTARGADCPKCGEPVLRGEDDDVLPWNAVVDVDPITPLDEMLAVLAGRITYDLTKRTGRASKPGAYELHHRYMERTKRPPRGTCHVEHSCKRGPV